MIPNVNRIYTLDVTSDAVIVDQQRIFLPPFPDIANQTVKGILISDYRTVAGQTDQGFITLLNSKKDVLLYTYPMQDLSDSSSFALVPPVPKQFFVRQFNLFDVETRASYFIFNQLSGPLSGLLFRISFYI